MTIFPSYEVCRPTCPTSTCLILCRGCLQRHSPHLVSLTSIRSLQLGSRGLNRASNLGLLGRTIAKGCGGAVGMNGHMIDEGAVWEGGRSETAWVTLGITGG